MTDELATWLISRHLNFRKCAKTQVFCTCWLTHVLLATAACNFSTSELQKMLQNTGFFLHFDLQMCFSPQRRAIFAHRNFKNCSETLSFLTFWLLNMLLATAARKFCTWELERCSDTVSFLASWLQAALLARAAYNFSTSQSTKRVSDLTFFVHFHFKNVLLATTACNFSTSVLQKVLRHRLFFNIFTCKCTSRRAILRHLNFKKWSEADVFCTFSLENVLLATTACNCSTSVLQKVLRHRLFFNIFTCKCTSRRAILRHLNFKNWSEADVFCTFSLEHVFLATAACNFWFLLWPLDSALPAFNGGCIFFFLALCYCIFCLLTWLLYFAFQLSILSEVGLLNFLRIWQIVEAHLLEHFETGNSLIANCDPWMHDPLEW